MVSNALACRSEALHNSALFLSIFMGSWVYATVASQYPFSGPLIIVLHDFLSLQCYIYDHTSRCIFPLLHFPSSPLSPPIFPRWFFSVLFLVLSVGSLRWFCFPFSLSFLLSLCLFVCFPFLDFSPASCTVWFTLGTSIVRLRLGYSGQVNVQQPINSSINIFLSPLVSLSLPPPLARVASSTKTTKTVDPESREAEQAHGDQAHRRGLPSHPGKRRPIWATGSP